MSLSGFGALAPLALAAGVALPAIAAANTHSHFDCRVTSATRLDHLGREGQQAELSRFTCLVHGGLLDGFVASGTNIWEPGRQRDVLLGSIVVAHKAAATVVYEVQQATRSATDGAGRGGMGRGMYRLATGSAAPLAGRSFRSVAHSVGADAFTLEIFLDE